MAPTQFLLYNRHNKTAEVILISSAIENNLYLSNIFSETLFPVFTTDKTIVVYIIYQTGDTIIRFEILAI